MMQKVPEADKRRVRMEKSGARFQFGGGEKQKFAIKLGHIIHRILKNFEGCLDPNKKFFDPLENLSSNLQFCKLITSVLEGNQMFAFFLTRVLFYSDLGRVKKLTF